MKYYNPGDDVDVQSPQEAPSCTGDDSNQR